MQDLFVGRASPSVVALQAALKKKRGPRGRQVTLRGAGEGIRTVPISDSAIRQRMAAAVPAAGELLRLCAFLGPEPGQTASTSTGSGRAPPRAAGSGGPAPPCSCRRPDRNTATPDAQTSGGILAAVLEAAWRSGDEVLAEVRLPDHAHAGGDGRGRILRCVGCVPACGSGESCVCDRFAPV
jgi:hypothetical protein